MYNSARVSPRCLLLDGLVRFSGDRKQDGFGRVLKKCCSVLGLALLDPVTVDLKGARIYELADGLHGIRVALYHLLGDGLGTAIVAVDSHCSENGQANYLMEKVQKRLWFLYELSKTVKL